ncbi:hypothetical protein TNIN_5171 [Trichonephila inaurata madagascariensis]|uniref:Uncharacterized protein n=1 Tax=Trichonephila inaurata madagascariensis TaxID=2747483 RepID=A0A8X6XSA9_9ARAC|nr:hypothetical protein TNIN_5171 [Trichonephila inaurata madagascariensis]
MTLLSRKSLQKPNCLHKELGKNPITVANTLYSSKRMPTYCWLLNPEISDLVHYSSPWRAGDDFPSRKVAYKIFKKRGKK